MKTAEQIIKAVDEVYGWLDEQTQKSAVSCNACGECCDFERYGHRLFITSPEFMHFASRVSPGRMKPMRGDKCPYNHEGKCSVYPDRFAGCRIFSCKGDSDLQSRLSEEVVEKFKTVCEEYKLPYRYTDLKSGLNRLAAHR